MVGMVPEPNLRTALLAILAQLLNNNTEKQDTVQYSVKLSIIKIATGHAPTGGSVQANLADSGLVHQRRSGLRAYLASTHAAQFDFSSEVCNECK
eukprot:3047186-Amphidinium_carterae.1